MELLRALHVQTTLGNTMIIMHNVVNGVVIIAASLLDVIMQTILTLVASMLEFATVGQINANLNQYKYINLCLLVGGGFIVALSILGYLL